MSRPYQLPMLPGYPSQAPIGRAAGKKQTLKFENGIAVVAGADGSPSGGKTTRRRRSSSGQANGEKGEPDWIKLDRKVLNFSAYFKEAVHERREEQFRVRKCHIYFYLVDDTIQIVEKKIENSGIAQGTLLKRHKVPKASANPDDTYEAEDFNVGMDVTLYGRTFHIVDCDAFTRDYMTKELGMRPNEPEMFPEDPYTTVRETQRAAMQPLRPYEKQDALGKFLKNDRKVLRYYCLWDDTTSEKGEKHYMVIHYFLADDSIEVREVSKPNSGRDGPSVFLRRQKLPKNKDGLVKAPGQATSRTVLNVFGDMKASRHMLDSLRTGSINDDFYTEGDLLIGNTIEVYGRPMLICDCDESTKQFISTNFGIEDNTPLPMEQSFVQAVEAELPPPTGFGTDEDSLASCRQLIPKVPKKKPGKFLPSGVTPNTVMRFQAVMLPSKREFVISYFLEDDTIGIFETLVRNSGFPSGKFMERRKVPAADGSGNVEATDLYVGAAVTLNRHEFHLVGADDFTLNFMEQRRFPNCDVNEITAKLRATDGICAELESGLQAAGDGTGLVNIHDFKDTLRSVCNGLLNEQEIITLSRQYGAKDPEEQDDLGQLVEQLQTVLAKENYDRFPNIHKAFLHYDKDRDGYLSAPQVQAICQDYNIPVSDELLAAVIVRMSGDAGKVDYQQFCEFLDFRAGNRQSAISVSQGETLGKALHATVSKRSTALSNPDILFNQFLDDIRPAGELDSQD